MSSGSLVVQPCPVHYQNGQVLSSHRLVCAFSVDRPSVQGPETTRSRQDARSLRASSVVTVRGYVPAPSWCSRLVEAVVWSALFALLDVRDDQLDSAIQLNDAVMPRAVTRRGSPGTRRPSPPAMSVKGILSLEGVADLLAAVIRQVGFIAYATLAQRWRQRP